MSTKGAYPWAEKQAQYATMSNRELSFAREDAYAAAKAMRGVDVVAEGWYMDDACTIAQEQTKRQKNPALHAKFEDPDPLTIEELFVPDCPNCGMSPCSFQCPNSPEYYSPEQERADSDWNDSLPYRFEGDIECEFEDAPTPGEKEEANARWAVEAATQRNQNWLASLEARFDPNSIGF